MSRAVLVVAAGDARGACGGAGYLIDDDLVLTARQVVADGGGACDVVIGEGRRRARPVWAGTERCPAALLRLESPVEGAGLEPVRQGRLVTSRRAPCATVGFSQDPHGMRASGGPTRLVGEVDRLSGWPSGARRASTTLTVHLVSTEVPADGESPRAWTPGAAVLCGPLLVGVIIGDQPRYGADRLVALAMTEIAGQPEFRAALLGAADAPLELETVETLGLLEPPYSRLPPPHASSSSSFLLGARYGVVPFQARPELDRLRDWCTGAPGLEVALVSGSGGLGKSRLARELCRELSERAGWVAGLLTSGAAPAALSGLARASAPSLVVVDYAETRLAQVIALLEGLAVDAAIQLRVVLIARQFGDWWATLPQTTHRGGVQVALASALELQLGYVAADAGERASAFRHAARAFARQTGGLTEPSAVDLSDPLFDRLLFVHMAALGATQDVDGHRAGAIAPVGSSLQAALLASTRAREARYWRDSAKSAKLGIGNRICEQVVAVATLASPTTSGSPHDESETAGLLAAVPGLDRPLRHRAARWLHDLYPSQSSWIGPCEPDLLGEALVADVLTQLPQLAGDLIGLSAAPVRHRVLTVLTRAARDHPACHDALASTMVAQLPDLAAIAVDVAQQTGDPIGQVLADALERRGDRILAGEVVDLVPDQTVSLTEAAIAALRLVIDGLPHGSDERAQLLRQYAGRLHVLGRFDESLAAVDGALRIHRGREGSATMHGRIELAQALLTQSAALMSLGRWEEALTPIDEAIGINRSVAEENLDLVVLGLGASLSNRASCLAELGRRDEALVAAEQAVEAARIAAEERPDELAGHYVAVQLTHAKALRALARHEDALAVSDAAMRRVAALAEDRPDAYRPLLAEALITKSAHLAGTGRHADAVATTEEALRIHRDLAETRPDAYAASRAAALANLAVMLRGVGRRDEAEATIDEAVAMTRRLARARPEAVAAQLARALTNKAAIVYDVDGRAADALEAADEAVRIQRSLARVRPYAHNDGLAMALATCSSCLSDLGRARDAVAAIDEVVGLYRAGLEQRPELLAALAHALYVRARRLRDVGRGWRALQSGEEAVAIYRKLVASDGQPLSTELARALFTISLTLSELGRVDQALAAVDEALRQALPFVEHAPEALPDAGAALLREYLACCDRAGQPPDDDLLTRMRRVLAGPRVRRAPS